MKGGLVMGIKKVKIGNNYILYDETDAGKRNTCNQIIKSWNNRVHYILEDNENGTQGLRSAQLGAIFSIRAHWTVSSEPATVVMPTGTGKTETMITTIVSEQCKKVFILVPTDLLRTQTAKNCASLGILKDIKVIDSAAKLPTVLCLKSRPKNVEDLSSLLSNVNIVVSTASLISRFNDDFMKILSKSCDTFIADEAHHIEANKWNNIKSFFTKSHILQFTATPFRNDGKKLDGDIIYNFPLFKAQEQGYFQKINFNPIVEFDDEIGDVSIAEAAVNKLDEDLSKGYNHIILVRANTVSRAKELFTNVYKEFYNHYNPKLILGEMPSREKNDCMDSLKNGDSRIVVCVDMFGEGIDIPNLKIAAIHDKYKSLPITLQFIGRFARSKQGLGDATVITNIANEDIQEALRELYSQDSDWNYLLSEMSANAIGKEISLQKLSNGFIGTGIKTININQLRPKLSMMAFSTQQSDWNWKNWVKVFDETKCKYYINETEYMLIVVEPEDSKIEWANYREVSNLNWQLHILYWNKAKHVAFINSTSKSIFNKFAEAIFDDARRISGECIFNCLYGINRLMLANVGLNSAINGPIRYKMFTGIDIVGAITESQKGNCYKSNLFGMGYNGNGKISIGCSHKGTIWSRWVETIDFWKNWCNDIYEKISNKNIKTVDVLAGVLQPEIVKSRPRSFAYRIDWPNELDISCDKNIYVETNHSTIPIYELEIGLIDTTLDEPLKFYVKSEELIEEFILVINEDGFYFDKIKSSNFILHIGKKEYSLKEYFQENQPFIKFTNQAMLEGNYYVTLASNKKFMFPAEQIVTWDWKGRKVNIKKESQKLTKETDSIQYNVIHEFLKDDEYSVIFDDDNSGEIADIVAIKECDNEIKFEFYHCKYSHEVTPGSRVADLYEVCGQAEKSVAWKQDIITIIDRMKYRESERLKKNKTTRFEKGDLKRLGIIRNKLRVIPVSLDIYIVQPGVDAKSLTQDMHQILCGTQTYLMDTYSIVLKLICS